MNPEVLAAILPRIYPQMLDEVHAHQDAGRATFIVSAAGNGVVEPLAEVLGMDGGIGTRYEVDGDGAFTGRFDGPFVYGRGQGRGDGGVRRRARDRPRRSPTPTRTRSPTCRCCEAVGHPVVVNPDPALAEIAKRRRAGRRCASSGSAAACVAVAVTLLATVAGFGASRIAATPQGAAPPLPPSAAERAPI